MKAIVAKLTNFMVSDDFNFILLLTMVTIYPFIVTPGAFPLRFTALVFLSIPAAYHLAKRGIRLEPGIIYPLAIFIVFLTLSTIFSGDFSRSWIGSYRRFTGFVTYAACLLFFLAAAQSRSRLLLIKAMVGAAAVISLIAIIQYFGLDLVPHWYIQEKFRSYGTMGNPNFLGTYTVFALTGSLILYLNQKQMVWLLTSILIYAALLTSMTRGAWLAFAAIFVLIILKTYSNKEQRKKLIIFLITMILVFFLLNLISDDSFISRASTIPVELGAVAEYRNNSVSIRIFVWQESLQILKDNWLVGTGPDTLQIPVPRGYVEDKAFNMFLEIAVTMGIFTLLGYLGIIFYCLRRKGSWVQGLLSMMIIAYLFQGQFNIDVLAIMPLYWIVLGLSLARDHGNIEVIETVDYQHKIEY